MIYTHEMANSSPSGHHMQCHEWFLTSREEVGTFVPSPSTLYLPGMTNVLLEIVHLCLAPGQKPLWPDTICGCTIWSTCTSHFGLDSCGSNSVGQGSLRVHKSGLTVQDRWWLSRTILCCG